MASHDFMSNGILAFALRLWLTSVTTQGQNMPTKMENHASDLSDKESLMSVHVSLSRALAKLDELGLDLAALKVAEALDLLGVEGE